MRARVAERIARQIYASLPATRPPPPPPPSHHLLLVPGPSGPSVARLVRPPFSCPAGEESGGAGAIVAYLNPGGGGRACALIKYYARLTECRARKRRDSCLPSLLIAKDTLHSMSHPCLPKHFFVLYRFCVSV